MPLLDSTYRASVFFQNGHVSTIFPTLFRRVPAVTYERTRLELADGDFLDLDWLRDGRRKLAIIAHGLESDSSAKYMRGMALALAHRGFDALCWNHRGCSGEPNRLPRSYHSGVSEDLRAVVDHSLSFDYQSLALVGFSLGGNITLKYLGEEGEKADPRLRAAVTFSVPCDLASSSRELAKSANGIYMRRFIKGLSAKVREKKERFPELGSLGDLKGLRSFRDFDERFTAPLNGFSGAEDYWEKASSKPFLDRIRVPTLLVNACDDPFLAPPCFPQESARRSAFFHLETPTHGGHTGFPSGQREYWSETRCAAFLSEWL
ncbi:MAG: YheT family hydrolase [Verrucomicrobiales bacterium]